MNQTSIIARAPDWEERLAVYLDRVAQEPFAWGEHDCALFAMGAVKAMTGVDPAELYRGTYSDRSGSADALRTLGSGTLLKTITAWFGTPKHPSLAHRGDVVMRDRNTLGICVGLYCWFVGEEGSHAGLVALPTADCTKAFTVPYSAPASAVEVR